jgi:hypothetical protein
MRDRPLQAAACKAAAGRLRDDGGQARGDRGREEASGALSRPRLEKYRVAFLLVILKAIIEVAMMALLGQFIVGIFAWGRRQGNVVYKLFQTIASPFTWVVRRVTPKVVLDTHIPLATLLLLAFAWLFVSISLRTSCTHAPTQAACERFQPVSQ